MAVRANSHYLADNINTIALYYCACIMDLIHWL